MKLTQEQKNLVIKIFNAGGSAYVNYLYEVMEVEDETAAFGIPSREYSNVEAFMSEVQDTFDYVTSLKSSL